MPTYSLAILSKASGVPTVLEESLAGANTSANTTMAPIELFHASSYIPTALVASHFLAIGYLSFIALHTIERSYAALPPSATVRDREPLRKGYVHTFSILALLSLATAFVYGMKYGSLSYQVWATERGIELPEGLFGDKGALRLGEHPGRLQVARWLNDTPLYRDAAEIVAETARFAWWGQQIDLSLTTWSVYLALEGQRRKISNLWAFLALAQLVSLSYAQNLFFLAVLLTPVPLPDNVRDLTRNSVPATSSWYSETLERYFPAKPDGFLPTPVLYVGLLLANFVAVTSIPLISNTPSFAKVAILSRSLPFSFLLLPYLIPDNWGKIHTHPHSAHTTYITLFRTISYSSVLLHGYSTGVALFKNVPDSTYYRHSLLLPFKKEYRSTFDRGTSAIRRVLGAIGEHPAVTSIGLDVLLSGLTLGTWAGIRGLDAREMLASSVPFAKPVLKELEESTAEVKEEVETTINKIEATPRRRGRPRKTEKVIDADDSSTVLAPRRRRGRPSKKSTLAHDAGDDDASYVPNEGSQLEEGDEEVEEDWEAAALAWGLISAGGLGVGSAAVYGAEVLAR